MIIFKFSKTGGAEFISHLDTMRHVQKTLVRTKIAVNYSQGFNPHMQVFLSPPLFVGLKSQSEYCLVETNETANGFLEKFNAVSPKGIKCLWAKNVQNKVKIASLIDRATYAFYGVEPFNVDQILQSSEIWTEIKGEQKNIRPKIFDLHFKNDVLYATLAFGNEILRADIFENYLAQNFSAPTDEIKLESYVGETPFDSYLLNVD